MKKYNNRAENLLVYLTSLSLAGVTSRSPKLKARNMHDIYQGDEIKSPGWWFGALLGYGEGRESK